MTSLNLFNSDHLLHLCQKYGLRPSKQYGQNYLIDQAVTETIIAAAKLKPDDIVVEVGPGFGVLTFALAARTQKVFAFEIEKKLLPYWEEVRIKNEELRNVEIVWGNVLVSLRGIPPRGGTTWQSLGGSINVDNSNSPENKGIASLLSRCESSSLLAMTQYKVVANLPYQITSPVIRLFLEAENPPIEMVLMVQKEVAERICAKPGDMSLLSVAVQYYADAEIVKIVPRSSFWPSPAVDSAVIKLTMRNLTSILSSVEERQSQPPLPDGRRGEGRVRSHSFDEQFFCIVKAGFAQRRKLLIKNLEPLVGKKNRPALQEAFASLGLAVTVRAQELSIEQWSELVCKVTKFVN